MQCTKNEGRQKTTAAHTFMRVSHVNHVLDNYINVLVLERRNSSALAMELRLSCTKPSINSEDSYALRTSEA